VTGFLGEDKHTAKPMPITEKEAERILHQVQEGVERPKPSITFEIGEQVRVSDGPFASFNGSFRKSTRSVRASRWKFRSSGAPCPSIWNSVRSRRADRSRASQGASAPDGWAG
jgi:transcription antitermination factor NusG